jgi:hypothetical protein
MTLAMLVAKDIEVAWDGSSYIVVYTTGTATRFGAQMTVRAARVKADGEVLSPQVTLSNSGSYFEPAIATSSAGALVVWADTKNGKVEGALLSHSDSVTPIAFPTIGRAGFTPAVAWNGETFLVAAPVLNDGIRWFFVSETGVVTTTPLTASLPWVPNPFTYTLPIEVQPLGSGFLLAYLSSGLIHAVVINRDGYFDGPPVVVARPGPYETTFGLGGATIVYARETDPLRRLFTKSVVARRSLSSGTVLSSDDLAIKKPGTGFPPDRLPDLVGKRLARAVAEDQLLVAEDIEGL